MELLSGLEVDGLLGWSPGKTDRLAKAGVIPFYVLPDGRTMRFKRDEVEGLVTRVEARSAPAPYANRMRRTR